MTLKLIDPCFLWYHLCQYQIPYYLKFIMLDHIPQPSVCLDLATPTMVVSQVVLEALLLLLGYPFCSNYANFIIFEHNMEGPCSCAWWIATMKGDFADVLNGASSNQQCEEIYITEQSHKICIFFSCFFISSFISLSLKQVLSYIVARS